jgi:hypothetical protein
MKARCHAPLCGHSNNARPLYRAWQSRGRLLHAQGNASRVQKEQGAESLGQWVVRGTATDPDATTYQCLASAASQPRFFLRVNNDTLQMLDGERREIVTTGNYTLTLTTTLPSLDPR